MQVEIPVLIESVRHGEDRSGEKNFSFRPLFFQDPCVFHKSFDSGLRDLADRLRDCFAKFVLEKNWDELTRRLFAPEVVLHRSELLIDIRKHVARISLPVATFDAGDRRIAFCPLLKAPWYEYGSPDDLNERTHEVFREHFRELAKKSGLNVLKDVLQSFGRPRNFQISYLDCTVNTTREYKEQRSKHSNRRQELIDSGKEQIEQVGLCLDRLYPKRLERAVFRDEIIDRVFRLLNDPNPRAVLLVGPPKVGKTAILHSVVSRMVEEIRRPDHDPYRRAVWQLTPGRLIAGMMQSGQWETRLNALFAYAEAKDLTLDFVQPIALLQTGKSSQGSLSMADMLLAALKRGRFRTICEMTEEQLRVLRERNRTLADQFEIVSVPEPDSEATLRMMMHTMRELEWTWKCSFDVDLLPLVMETTGQFENDAAMPGKAIQWLANLAVQHEGGEISRNDFLRAFGDKTGLRLSFFKPSDSRKTESTDFETFLKERIVGQEKPVAELKDVVLSAESLLSDPKRPIASLFFLGPTGVGKTECAKQLARHFFGDEKRLLRFDANELCTSTAVARLVGTHQDGDGILTGAIRRQPFSVVLFDEIEKGHPDLFDLLLQVVEEARLTDTQGRVASFSQAIIIFTSNLGTRQAASRTGFVKSAGNEKRDERFLYRKAVEDFFRPEFVNRLDRIIPFESLSSSELRQIGDRMLNDVFSREGLLRRKTCLVVTAKAQEMISRQNIDPVFGARGIRRLLERELVAPISRFLASSDHRHPTIIEISDRGGELSLQCCSLRISEEKTAHVKTAERIELLTSSEKTKILSAAKDVLRDLRQKILLKRPRGRFDITSLSAMDPVERLYFPIHDALDDLQKEADELLEFEQTNKPRVSPGFSLPQTSAHEVNYRAKKFWKRIQADQDLKSALDELFREKPKRDRLFSFLKRISELSQAVDAIDKPVQHVALLVLSTVNRDSNAVMTDDDFILKPSWVHRTVALPLDGDVVGLATQHGSVSCTTVRGPGAFDFWRLREGTALRFDDESLSATALLVFEIPAQEDDLPKMIGNRLNDPEKKWPSVTKISRCHAGRTEETTLAELGDSMPEPVREIFESFFPQQTISQ